LLIRAKEECGMAGSPEPEDRLQRARSLRESDIPTAHGVVGASNVGLFAPSTHKSPGRVVIAAGLTGLVLLAAGCGGHSPTPSVASLGATNPATTTSEAQGRAAGGGGGNVPGGSAGSFSSTMRVGSAGTAFSACMRSHGVPNFPDPNGQGAITFGSSDGIDPSSPQFQSAQKTCQKLLPNGGIPTPAQQAQAQARMLSYSACMRSHGVPKFPDPNFSGGHISLSISSGSGIDPQSPQFQSAQKACQGDLPGKLGGAKIASAGGGKTLGGGG
jgi:hypothetical protein